jgi:hypothetical protein
MSTTAPTPVTTPIPVQLSESEFEAFLLPYLSMPKRGPKCKLGYYRVFNLIIWVLYTRMQWKCLPIPHDAVSVNLLYGFGRFNLQNPGYPPAHFPWCEPCLSHRVVRYQPHAIATMAGGFYGHGSAPLAAARSFSPGHRCVPAGFSPL